MKKILCIIISLFLIFPFKYSPFAYGQGQLSSRNCSLNMILEELGFYKEVQKDSFKRLCNCAGIELPNDFTSKSLLELVMNTQKLFTNRKSNQERWEINPLDWMKKNSKQNLEDIKTLGFIDDILPKNKKYDAVCVLGAVNSTMKNRIKFLEKLVDSGIEISRIFLLSSERYVSYVDGNDEEILEICKKFEVDKKNLTEAHLIKNIFDSSSLSKNYTSILIDTRSINGSRPTTKTTVQDFCKWAKDNNFKDNVLFISSQPNIFYQKSIISEVLDNVEFEFEVIGPKTESKDVQNLVGALGSYLWAYMPKIIIKSGFNIESSEEIQMAKSLYGFHPLFM